MPIDILAALEAVQKNDVIALQGFIQRGIDINFRFMETRPDYDITVENIFWNIKKTTGWFLNALGAARFLTTLGGPVSVPWALFFGTLGTTVVCGCDNSLADITYNRQQWTLLHFAAAADARDAAEVLINAGAKTDLKDTSEKTFLIIARELRNLRFVEICEIAIRARDAMLPAMNNERERAQQAQQREVAIQAERNQALAERNFHANQHILFAQQAAQLRAQRDTAIEVARAAIA